MLKISVTPLVTQYYDRHCLYAYYTFYNIISYNISQSVYILEMKAERYRKQETAIKVNKNSFEKQTRR